MNSKFAAFFLFFAVFFAACAKKNVQPGSSSSADSIPYGFSMVVNGKFSTFNSFASVDTTENEFDYTGTGDSACCTNMLISWGLSKFDNSALTTGIYPASGYDLENQSEWTIYASANWGYTSQIGFLAYPDSVNVTEITDTTITGTFSGTCTGIIQNQNYPYNNIDSIMIVSNGKFHLKKH
jgi:hypothetical protein